MKMPRRGQIRSWAEAVPGEKQHTKPCIDCPWARKSFPTWLGGMTAEEWLAAAHGEAKIDCHTVKDQQCAGSAIYRGNVCKSPRTSDILKLPPNRELVFANPAEFRAHHDSTKDD